MGPRSSDRGNLIQRGKVRVEFTHLQWGRDLPTAEIPEYATHMENYFPTFNGAAIFRPRKFEDNLAYAKALRNLQWGRDLPTAEITEDSLQYFRPRKSKLRSRHPSMGPRSSDRGNVPTLP